ncbi:helix-turn-helix domain-containing protein [Variovorax dokdonensis]|uniref:Helix-turn-helix domain-containing protein n=1 Tax=Variovorax dokdonensis TaxID=344883 RepID=A0ABT7NFF1_9BURK|nr:helix-turn-helix domain-containing protein [Variovorax dokdonensis]MDM0046600.1 helix-turn-helix domain-containing protein [Variovorax dokdonensis]
MDALISAAARALAAGDALGALKRVALRDDPAALALRGIAMAQLGEHVRARHLLQRAARRFGAEHESLARARCIVAEAEVALAMRDLGSSGASPRALTAAASTLAAHDDHANALQAKLIAARRLLLLGRLGEASALLSTLDLRQGISPAMAAVADLSAAELALRSLRIDEAQALLARARALALRADVPALVAEVNEALEAMRRPAARRAPAVGASGLGVDEAADARPLELREVAALMADPTQLVLDACRRGLRCGTTWLPLARRPVPFALLRALAHAWPGDVAREFLIADAFRTRNPDETHRARLRVEMGRLRALVKPLARIEATASGFALQPLEGRSVVVLAPPIDGEQAALQALLSDGAAWSTSALALALDASQRTVQRALAELEAQGRVRSVGRARAQRWLAPPLAGFTTILLLPAALQPA